MIEIKQKGLLAHVDADTKYIKKLHFDSVDDYMRYLNALDDEISTAWTVRDNVSDKRMKQVQKEVLSYQNNFLI